jgi:copper ion binding protein
MNQQITLKISGMGCAGCVATVEKALKGVAGVAAAKVDLKTGQAAVEFDPAKTSAQELTAAVIKAGYKAG